VGGAGVEVDSPGGTVSVGTGEAGMVDVTPIGGGAVIVGAGPLNIRLPKTVIAVTAIVTKPVMTAATIVESGVFFDLESSALPAI